MKDPVYREIDIHNQWFEHDRRNRHHVANQIGGVYFTSLLLWRKVEKTQRYAVYMIDSVVNGSLVEAEPTTEFGACARTSARHTMEIKHSDKKYPPWEHAKERCRYARAVATA